MTADEGKCWYMMGYDVAMSCQNKHDTKNVRAGTFFGGQKTVYLDALANL